MNNTMCFLEDDTASNDKRYTAKIEIPHYKPSDVKPRIEELFNLVKYKTLLRDINMANISDDEKEFLKFAATRHIVFNYAKIADYYAHANPEMQRLMENSALVILDVDNAIANGYIKLSKDIKAILENSGEIANEE